MQRVLDPTDGLLPTTFWSECSRPEYVRRCGGQSDVVVVVVLVVVVVIVVAVVVVVLLLLILLIITTIIIMINMNKHIHDSNQ